MRMGAPAGAPLHAVPKRGRRYGIFSDGRGDAFRFAILRKVEWIRKKATDMPKTIAVIDGNSLMHRAYHAVPPTMNAADGTPTHAVFGFLSMLLKFIDVASPDAIVCAFDAGKPAFRIEAMEEYKAQRPPMDDDLRVQFPLIEDLLESMDIPVVKVPGWEGDYILGTVAARAEALGCDVLLVTGDKDACQLASEHTRIFTTKKGISDVVVFDPAMVEEKYGVAPAQIPDFLGLMGDSSDNIPGVPGIGQKTAAKLLQRFGSMEGIYQNLDQLKGKQLENLQNNRDVAFLSRDVATIVRDLDFPLELESLSFPSYQAEAVSEAFGKLGMNLHLNKVLSLIGGSATASSAQARFEEIEPLEGDDALEAIGQMMEAAEEERPLGLAVRKPSQESLFGAAISLALSDGGRVALVDGDCALETLKRLVVGQVPFAVLDAKAAFQVLYPADASLEAHITADQMDGARVFDIQLAAYVLDSSVSDYSLQMLMERELGCVPDCAEGEQPGIALEAQAAFELFGPLVDKLEADGTTDVYRDIDLPLVSVLVQMERTGAALDAECLERIGAETAADLDRLVAQIYQEAGCEFNVDSPKQVGHVLFEVIGLKPLKKTSRGYSTDAKVLTELAKEHVLPGLILKYRELAKIKGTYIDALPKLRRGDGRLHTTFNETVTATGRLSSSNPNLQNIPVRTDFGRRIRECFVPFERDHVFMSADYSQIELRLLAHLSQDEHLIAAFNSGADFHAATASRVFGVPADQVTPQLRSRAKAVNFGIVYGQQAFGLGQTLDIPFGEAQALIDQYFCAYPDVRRYLDEVVRDAKEGSFAQTMFGRKRHIPELKVKNAQKRAFGERTAMNHPMQGSAADIIKKAMVEVQRRLRREFPEAKLMIQVHDELDLSVPADQAQQVAAMLCEVMENVVSLRVPLSVDASWGDNWAQAH